MSITVRLPGAERLLDLWDAARGQHPIDRALTIAQACTDLDRAALAQLSIGQRDALLIDLRRRFAGDRISGVCRCEMCSEANEFELDAAALPPPEPPSEGVVLVEVAGRAVRARLPNSIDLAAVVGITDEAEAARMILQRCLLDRAPPDAPSLGDGVVAALDRAMDAVEGAAGLEIAFACSACGAPNHAPFDIAAFLWAELTERAERLIDQVDALASAYGWSEAEILGLPERRRQVYVSRIGR
jgi:hypothetical protein